MIYTYIYDNIYLLFLDAISEIKKIKTWYDYILWRGNVSIILLLLYPVYKYVMDKRRYLSPAAK